MIKKKKDQEQNHFPKEKYVQDYEKWFSEEEYQRNDQRRVQESRKKILHELNKINRSLENFEKDCVYCNYQGTYSIQTEPNLDDFSYQSLEEDLEEVICVNNKKPIHSEEIVQELSYKEIKDHVKITTEDLKCFIRKYKINHILPSDYLVISPIVKKFVREEQFNDVELKNLRKLQRSSKTMILKDKKSPLKKEKKRRKLRAVSKKETIDSTNNTFKKKTLKGTKKQRKNAFKKSIVLSNTAKFLAIFGITFISLMAFISPETFSFPMEVIAGFLYIQVFIYLVFLYLSIEKYVFSVRSLFYLFISPILLFIFVTIFISLEWIAIATACTPLAAFHSYRMMKKRLKININKISLNLKGRFRYGTLTVFYHKFKFPILTVLSLILGGVFIWTYFFDPYSSIMAPPMFTLIIFAFTFKSKAITRKIITKLKRQKQKDRGIRTPKRNVIVVYDKNIRAALFILVFLLAFTITFGIGSMYSVQNPMFEFAQVPQEERLSTSSIDFSNLDYLSGLDNLEELSINDKFVIKCDISPLLGQSARVRLELIPKEVAPIEGFHAKKSYSVLSPYLNGPLEDRELITEVNLNELNLMPGTYEAKVTYTILSCLSFRASTPEVYEITIAKDDLTVISNDIFEDVLDSKYYGAVYTFEHPDDGSWTVVFDGKLVNSIREPFPVEELDLYVEQNDRYEKIATVSTKKDGTFYYTHKVYGSIEQNMLVKISWGGDGFYNPMNYVEYAGLEFDAVNGRYFLDNNMDLYPDWPFSLYDLLKAHASSYTPPGSLDFWAKFDENLDYSTFDSTYHNYEGILEGNTTWTVGKNDYGLEFDGIGIIDSQEIETIGSNIFAIYANVSYEYTTEGQDFKVLRGTTIFSSGSATTTITEGVDYTLESGQDSTTCFIRLTNTRLTGMGRTSGGGNQNLDDFGVRIQNPSNIGTSITFERTGTSNDCRASWEILQYIGSNGGANEMIVRGVGTATCSGTTATCDGSSISTISDRDKVVVYITGQKAAGTGRGDWWESLFTADLFGFGPYTPRFTRGKFVDSSDSVSYAVVEFIGSNWRNVQRLDISTECSTAWTTSNYNTAYSDVTIASEGGVNLLNYSRAFMHQQYRTDNDATGLDDCGDNIEIISNTQLRIRNSATSGNRYKVCWIIENTQSTGIVMKVEHNWYYKGTGGSEENGWTETITSVSSMDTTSVFVQASMDGTKTTLPRGSIDYRLTATDTITLTESDNGQEKLYSVSIVQFPSIGEIQSSGVVRPDGDVVTQWETSSGSNHWNLLDDVVEEPSAPSTSSDYIYTISTGAGNITDEFNMGYMDVQSGTVTQVQVKVYGNETNINSIINLYCGSWLGIKQLDMVTSPSWHTYTWTVPSASQTDLNSMKIKFESERPTPEEGPTIYSNFDYVQFGDVLDDTLGDSNNEFVITGWLYPTILTSNLSSNGVKNVFFAKDGNIEIGVDEDGFLQLYLFTSSIEAVGIYGFSGAIPLDQWTYIAIRFNQGDVDVLIQDTWCRDALGGTSEPWNGGGSLQSGGNLTIGAETMRFASFTGIIDIHQAVICWR